MRLNFVVNEITGGWEPNNHRMPGATERGVVEWAEELVNRGHSVWVYYNQRTYGMKTDLGENQVMWMPRSAYGEFEPVDICINIKSPEIEPKEPTIFYTNDVDADKQDLSKYGAVVHISNWAKDNIPVNNSNVFVVPHGYDPNKIYPGNKVLRQCLYASSPDRGLDTLLRAWPKVYAKFPDATLFVTYGAEAMNIPGVTFLDDVDDNDMDELYRTSDIWCHPANGGELQCVSGLKAQAAGCWPVIIPTMALSETVKFGIFSTKETYADDLIKALENHPQKSYKGITIKESTDKLLEVVQFVLDGNN